MLEDSDTGKLIVVSKGEWESQEYGLQLKTGKPHYKDVILNKDLKKVAEEAMGICEEQCSCQREQPVQKP